jgi:hypothetical protein
MSRHVLFTLTVLRQLLVTHRFGVADGKIFIYLKRASLLRHFSATLDEAGLRRIL